MAATMLEVFQLHESIKATKLPPGNWTGLMKAVVAGAADPDKIREICAECAAVASNVAPHWPDSMPSLVETLIADQTKWPLLDPIDTSGLPKPPRMLWYQMLDRLGAAERGPAEYIAQIINCG